MVKISGEKPVFLFVIMNMIVTLCLAGCGVFRPNPPDSAVAVIEDEIINFYDDVTDFKVIYAQKGEVSQDEARNGVKEKWCIEYSAGIRIIAISGTWIDHRSGAIHGRQIPLFLQLATW